MDSTTSPGTQEDRWWLRVQPESHKKKNKYIKEFSEYGSDSTERSFMSELNSTTLKKKNMFSFVSSINSSDEHKIVTLDLCWNFVSSFGSFKSSLFSYLDVHEHCTL